MATSIETAARRVREVEQSVERQRRTIAGLRERGRDTSDAETMLGLFERSLAIFRADRDSKLSNTAGMAAATDDRAPFR